MKREGGKNGGNQSTSTKKEFKAENGDSVEKSRTESDGILLDIVLLGFSCHK